MFEVYNILGYGNLNKDCFKVVIQYSSETIKQLLIIVFSITRELAMTLDKKENCWYKLFSILASLLLVAYQETKYQRVDKKKTAILTAIFIRL